MIFRFMV